MHEAASERDVAKSLDVVYRYGRPIHELTQRIGFNLSDYATMELA